MSNETTALAATPKGGLIPNAAGVYPFHIGKQSYALGKINVAKDAYRQTFKRLATYAAFNRDKNLGEVMWNFESAPITRGKYSWFAPMLTVSQTVPDKAVAEWIAEFNGN